MKQQKGVVMPAEASVEVKGALDNEDPHQHEVGFFNRLISRARNVAHVDSIKLVADAILIVLAAIWVWFVSFSQVPQLSNPLPFLGIVVGARWTVYMVMRLHHLSWTKFSRYELLRLALSALLGTPLILLLFFLLPQPFTLRAMVRPYLVVLTEPALYLLLLSTARFLVRSVLSESNRRGGHRILIVGARDAGRSLAFQLQESNTNYDVVGFVDEDQSLRRRRIRGLPVLGGIKDVPRIIEKNAIDEIVIAIPSMPPDELRALLANCSPTHLPVRILPPLKELIGGKANAQSLREVRMEDLLPRPEVNLNRAALASYLKDRTVLVTGGGGSIGGELCRQVLDAGAGQLIVLGRGENSVFEMMSELGELNAERAEPCRLIPAICDVREHSALEGIFERYRPQVVFHAAAHKHVPLMEAHASEAVKNNVGGTLNVVQLSCKFNVERFVMVSTDKAVDPSSIMGATKRICELIVRGHATHYKTNMVSVRFGNVLGSRGSVVPTMTRQIRRRLPVTITDPEMVRYFMTIPEAVQLVLQAGAKGGEGDVFMLEMGRPVRILDMAYDLIRLSGLVPEQDIPIRIIGRRPGEKIEEVLLSETEERGVATQGDFHVAPATEVRLDTLTAQLERLQSAAGELDDSRVRQVIKEIVPNFHNEFLANGSSTGSADGKTSDGKTSDGSSHSVGQGTPAQSTPFNGRGLEQHPIRQDEVKPFAKDTHISKRETA